MPRNTRVKVAKLQPTCECTRTVTMHDNGTVRRTHDNLELVGGAPIKQIVKFTCECGHQIKVIENQQQLKRKQQRREIHEAKVRQAARRKQAAAAAAEKEKQLQAELAKKPKTERKRAPRYVMKFGF